jgi:hypothetical protein
MLSRIYSATGWVLKRNIHVMLKNAANVLFWSLRKYFIKKLNFLSVFLVFTRRNKNSSHPIINDEIKLCNRIIITIWRRMSWESTSLIRKFSFKVKWSIYLAVMYITHRLTINFFVTLFTVIIQNLFDLKNLTARQIRRHRKVGCELYVCRKKMSNQKVFFILFQTWLDQSSAL